MSEFEKFSGGRVKVVWIPGVCQNLREKQGFPKVLMQKRWKIPGVVMIKLIGNPGYSSSKKLICSTGVYNIFLEKPIFFYIQLKSFHFSFLICLLLAEETPTCADVEIEDFVPLTKSQRRRLQKERKRLELDAYYHENEARNVYPTDLWFLIGRYVPPESVRTFAAICRDARRVTCSTKFWLELYNR